ncbi:MAG: SdiA-regulated domain-containing protein, partial [Verrucomicrobiales bacterium]
SKTYDGNTNATITGTLVGVVSPDVVTFNGTGTFASSAVGTGIAVTSTSTLGGANAGNYSLTQPTGLTGNITADTAVDLSRYVRVARYDLPEPTRTTAPSGSLLAQEASNVTYNWDTDTLFIAGDGGTSIVQVSKTGALINSMTLALNASRRAGVEFDDTEGLTYIGNGEFVMTEERDRTLVKFTYAAGTTLTRAAAKTVKLGTTIGNIGLEGVCYDPQTGGFIVVKEKTPESIFQTNIDWNALTATNGSPTATSSTDLFNPSLIGTLDVSDVFAMSNLPALNGTSESSHLLVISQESGQVVNCDRSGNVYSRLTISADPGSVLTVPDMTMEGVCMDRSGNLYIANENGGGDANHPQLWVYAPSTATNVAPTAVALQNPTNSIPENTSTAADVKLADIIITDDGLGVNNLTVSGADAASFSIVGTSLFLKAGTTLNSTAKPTYAVTVNVDDTSAGSTPDASVNFTLTVTASTGGTPQLVISEVAPWSSSNSIGLLADWFEVTNIGTAAQSIVGWKMDDNSNAFGSAVALNGITSIAPGESVIFIESASPAAAVALFKTLWFGSSSPATLQIGTYTGSGVGLSTAGDAVNIFNAAGAVQARVDFGANGTGPFKTFDNASGLNNVVLTNLAASGINGAFIAASDSNEIGSPGTIGGAATPIISIVATDANAAETGNDPGTFRISRSGSTTGSLTVNYTVAIGAGQAIAADYTPTLNGAAIIPSGQSYVDITITPVDDALVEGNESLTLTLFDTGSYDVGSPSSATVTIVDNDLANQAPTAVAVNNPVTSITEITPTTADIKVGDIVITDDGQGTNTLSLSGTDAASFTITGSALYLKAGTTLNHTTKPSYAVTVNVDDTTVGSTPDASVAFALSVIASPAPGSIIISEVAPWGSSNSPAAVDWFEITNNGTTAVDITGWKADDNSNSFSVAASMSGVTSIAPGESVVFLETTDLPGKSAAFKTLWFGGSPPAGLQVGAYAGSGVGLSSAGDALNLFDISGNRITGVNFGASSTGTFYSFDNKAGLGST